MGKDSEIITVNCAMSVHQVFDPYYFDRPMDIGERYKKF